MNQMDKAIKDGKAIFVFGSNLAGAHGAGAAAYAVKHWGAVFGKGIGLHGMSYAIPTKNHMIRTMPLKTIKPYVMDFIRFAKLHPTLQFKVTQIGCGLTGYEAKDIAPMFIGATENCWFDTAWLPWLKVIENKGRKVNYWGNMS